MAARALAAAVALAALVIVLDLVAGPFFSFSAKAWPPEARGTRVIGGIQGAIKHTDADTTTVRVASGFLGLSSVSVIVTPQTRIGVGGKLGGFADLARGQLVRIGYELLPGRLLASRIDVLDRATSESSLAAPTAADAAVGAEAAVSEAAGPSETVPSTELPRAATSSSSPVPQWSSVPPSMPAPAAEPERPKRAPSRAAKKPVSSVATPAPARAAVSSVPVPVVRAPAPRPEERAPSALPSTRAPGEDGTAAVDWLLKQP